MNNVDIHRHHIHALATDYVQEQWTDWKWQQRNAVKTVDELSEFVSNLPLQNMSNNAKDRKIQVTPYYLSLIQESKRLSGHDKLLNQVIPYWETEIEDGYNGTTENWELDHEMKTPICQHKYDNRVILRIANVCNAYCQFCFEALRTIDTNQQKSSFNRAHWKETIDYIASNPDLQEVIFSGGEPLMLDDSKLSQCLRDVRSIRPEMLIRIHSRALTFNPFRITSKLLDAFSETQVSAFGVHVCHPDELTSDFACAVSDIRTVVPITFANIPILKGINDDYETLKDLFLKLYSLGVVPYYLYHFMPFSPGSSEYRTSVRDVIRIMQLIKRRISNIAVPEYVLPHRRGKYTVPLIDDPEDFPRFLERDDGKSVYRFKNWLGETHEWLDG